MGQILHGSATTTHAIRAAIQRSKAPLKELVERLQRFLPSLDSCEHALGIGSPDEGFWVGVGLCEEPVGWQPADRRRSKRRRA